MFRTRFTRGLIRLLPAALLIVPTAYAEDPDTEVCIKEINGRVVVIEGECPGFGAHPGALPGTGTAKKKTRSSVNDAAQGGSGGAGGSSSGAGKSSPGSAGSSGGSAGKAGSSGGSAGKAGSSGGAGSRDDAGTAAIRRELDRIRETKDEGEAMAAFEDLVARGEAVVGAVSRVYRDSNADPRTRWVAGRALGRIPGKTSYDALIAGLKDPQPMARIAAARALADQGDRRAMPALSAALKDPGAIVRAAVVDTIATLGTSQDAALIARELTAKHNFVKGYGLFVRAHAATALGKLGGDDALKALIEVVDDRDRDTRDAARAALSGLTGRSTPPPGSGSEKERWMVWYRSRASGTE